MATKRKVSNLFKYDAEELKRESIVGNDPLSQLSKPVTGIVQKPAIVEQAKFQSHKIVEVNQKLNNCQKTITQQKSKIM